jgi:hypothetical protein
MPRKHVIHEKKKWRLLLYILYIYIHRLKVRTNKMAANVYAVNEVINYANVSI